MTDFSAVTEFGLPRLARPTLPASFETSLWATSTLLTYIVPPMSVRFSGFQGGADRVMHLQCRRFPILLYYRVANNGATCSGGVLAAR